MNLFMAIRKKFRWYHPLSAAVLLFFYFIAIRPFRVAVNERWQLPLLEYYFHGRQAVILSSDSAGTGALFQIQETGLEMVLAVPFGIVFLAFACALLLTASPLRYFFLLLLVHLSVYAVSLGLVFISGFATPKIIQMVPAVQHYALIAASFAILFFSLRQEEIGVSGD